MKLRWTTAKNEPTNNPSTKKYYDNNSQSSTKSVPSEDELVNQIFERNQEQMKHQHREELKHHLKENMADINDKTAKEVRKIKNKFHKFMGKVGGGAHDTDEKQRNVEDSDEEDSWANDVEVVANYNVRNSINAFQHSKQKKERPQQNYRDYQQQEQNNYHRAYEQHVYDDDEDSHDNEGKQMYFVSEESYNPATTINNDITNARMELPENEAYTTEETTSTSNNTSPSTNKDGITRTSSLKSLIPPKSCYTETRLFKAIEDREWRSAIVRVRHSPIEASMWVSCASSTNNIYTSTHKMLNANTDVMSGGKLLPIHCACVQKAPLVVFRELLKALPSSIKARDSNGNLPLHYAVRFGISDLEILDLLLTFYPDSIDAMDCDGLTPIVIAVNCIHSNTDGVVNMLNRGKAYYTNKSNRDLTLENAYDSDMGYTEEDEEQDPSNEPNGTFIPPKNHRPDLIQTIQKKQSNPQPVKNEPIWNKNNLSIVIIGASNEITRKKIFPSLYNLYTHDLLPSNVAIYSLGKSSYKGSDVQLAFREKVKSCLTQNDQVDSFLSKLYYHQVSSYDDLKSYQTVSEKLTKHEESKIFSNRLFFLCVSNHLFFDVGCMLKQSGLYGKRKGCWCRIMVEDWVGCSLDSAENCMRCLGVNFEDDSLFRVDHYLGKEQIRNLLFLRFTNILFDNLWNRDHIQCIILSYKQKDHKKKKAQYTDAYGIIKEVIQTHLMNIVTLLTMEAPRKLEGSQCNEEVHRCKLSVLESIPSICVDDCLLGQYEDYIPPANVNTPNTLNPSGLANTLTTIPATKTDDVTTNTTTTYSTIEEVIQNTPTYAVVRCFIRTPRWENVPIILQAATGVDEDVEEIKIQFKNKPSIDFLLDDVTCSLPRNELVFRSDEKESIILKTNCKIASEGIFDGLDKPQQMLTRVENPTGFAIPQTETYYDPDPYTRCILDVLRNKHGVGFQNQDEILQTWHIFLPLYQSFFGSQEIHKYEYGSSGPNVGDWIRRKSGYKVYDGEVVEGVTSTAEETVTKDVKEVNNVIDEEPEKQRSPIVEEENNIPEEVEEPVIARTIPSKPKTKKPSKSGEYDIGVFGLTPFGQTLVLNMASNGYKVCIGSSKQSRLDCTLRRASKELHEDNTILTARTAQEFISNLSIPRKVILIGISSKPIDGTISALMKLLDEGDIIIDTGIEWYSNCLKRFMDIENKGIMYMNLSTSFGGDSIESLIHNPTSLDPLKTCNNTCFMFSGPKEAYDTVYDIFKGCAMIHPIDAKPCIGYIGNIGSVNYTKMMQNGIEYGFMQLLSEIYDVMKHVLALHNEDMSSVFQEWNASEELKAFLVEITGIILKKRDSSKSRGRGGVRQEFVVDNILDKVNMKGIGKFIMQEASEQNQVLSMINASLDARFVCAKKSVRESASKILKGPSLEQAQSPNGEDALNVKILKDALYASLICLYSQGFSLLSSASDSKGFDLDLATIAKLLNISSPIQSNLLNEIYNSFQESSHKIDSKSASLVEASLPNGIHTKIDSSNIMLLPNFSTILNESIPSLRKVIVSCIENGTACPTLSASLSYFDSLRRNNLPANLIQAQRNFIGGHSFERVDRAGVYRCAWTEYHHKVAKNSKEAAKNSKGKNKKSDK